MINSSDWEVRAGCAIWEDLAVKLIDDVSWEVRAICAHHKKLASQMKDDSDWRVRVVVDSCLNEISF